MAQGNFYLLSSLGVDHVNIAPLLLLTTLVRLHDCTVVVVSMRVQGQRSKGTLVDCSGTSLRPLHTFSFVFDIYGLQ